jgi:5-methylcytosine-specific restriction endonuclease McrA
MTFSPNDKCKLCGTHSRELLATFYGVNICVKCDSEIKKYGISSLESLDLSRLKEYINDYTESIKKKSSNKQFYQTLRYGFHSIRIPIEYEVKDPPHSKTLQEIKGKGLAIGLITFLLVLILGLFYFGLFLSLVVSLFFAVALNKTYISILSKIHKPSMQDELAQSQADIDRRNKELELARQQRLEQYAQWKVRRQFPKKYLTLAAKIQTVSPPLYEYYLYEYPPDWEERAETINKRDCYCCTKCGHTADLAVHHKKPVKKGGDHPPPNLVTLCNRCHLDEHPSLKARIMQEQSWKEFQKGEFS